MPKLCLDVKEAILVKKLLKKQMREDKLYEDEKALSQRIVEFLNEAEGEF